MTGRHKVQGASFGLVLHAQHIFASYLIFFVTWGLQITVFHSTCIFCVCGMAPYWPTLQLCVCVYVAFVCRYVVPHGECYYNTLLCCKYLSSSSVVSRAFSALCMYSKFGHHPYPVSYLCAKFRFFRDLHCWANPWRKTAYSINHSPSSYYSMSWEPKLALRNLQSNYRYVRRHRHTVKFAFHAT